MSKRTLIVAIVIAGLAAVCIWLVFKGQEEPTLTNEDRVVSTNESIDAMNMIDEQADGSAYGIDEEANQFYVVGTDGKRQAVATPFELELYHVQVMPIGTLFWKRGPDAETKVEDFDEPYVYEDGVNPEFQWFDSTAKKFYELPALVLQRSGTKFERIFGVWPSVSEQKILIEVGEYDTAGSAFGPGLVEEQPEQTHGVVYDVAKRVIDTGDPLVGYLKALGIKTTLFVGMSWDSKRQQAIGVPGGEGCGAYDVIKLVNLKTQSASTIGGPKSFTFKDETCNPSNGISPDGKWFILYGTTTDGKRLAILFDHEHGATPVKQRSFAAPEGDEPDYVDTWDLTKSLPSITFAGGESVDFNT